MFFCFCFFPAVNCRPGCSDCKSLYVCHDVRLQQMDAEAVRHLLLTQSQEITRSQSEPCLTSCELSSASRRNAGDSVRIMFSAGNGGEKKKQKPNCSVFVCLNSLCVSLSLKANVFYRTLKAVCGAQSRAFALVKRARRPPVPPRKSLLHRSKLLRMCKYGRRAPALRFSHRAAIGKWLQMGEVAA